MPTFFFNTLGAWTLFRRETARYLKVYVQTLVSPIISNLLFFGVFGGMFASRSVGIEGIDYLAFMVPGLSMMGALNAGFQNPSSSIIIQKYQGLHEELNSYPLTTLEKTLAFTLSATMRGVLVGLLTYITSIPFVGTPIAHPIGFIVILAVVAFLFSCIGLVIGLVAKTFDTVNFATTIVITPLTFLGGVFFEVTKLPEPFASLAVFNPIFPMIDSARLAFLGVSELSLFTQLTYILPCTTICFIAAYICMDKGIGLRS